MTGTRSNTNAKPRSTSHWPYAGKAVSHPGGTVTRCSTRCCVTAIWHLPCQWYTNYHVLHLLAKECHMCRVVSRYGESTRWSFLGTVSLSGHPLSSWLLSLAHLRYGTLAGHQRPPVWGYKRLTQFVSCVQSLTKGR